MATATTSPAHALPHPPSPGRGQGPRPASRAAEARSSTAPFAEPAFQPASLPHRRGGGRCPERSRRGKTKMKEGELGREGISGGLYEGGGGSERVREGAAAREIDSRTASGASRLAEARPQRGAFEPVMCSMKAIAERGRDWQDIGRRATGSSRSSRARGEAETHLGVE